MIQHRRPSPTPGIAQLRVTQVDGASSVTSAVARSPSRWLLPRTRGEAVWACLSGFGGGLVSGDRVEVTLDVEDGACAFIGTQASTKVYKAHSDAETVQTWTVSVGATATLIALPDPLTCFAQARYRQQQSIQLADETASLVWLDWCTSGRHHNAERWAFERYDSTLTINQDKRRLVTDGMLLDATHGSLSRRLDGYAIIATAVVIGPATAAINRHIATQAGHQQDGIRWTASPLADGHIVRLMAADVEVATRFLRELIDVAPILGDHPWLRK